MSMSAEMEEVLTSIAEDFASAEVFNQWAPPDGDYTILLYGYGDGVSARGGNKTGWWRLDGRLLLTEGNPLNGKEFSIVYRSTVPGILKTAMAALAGRKINDVRQAEPILGGAVGWIVNIRKSTNTKDGVDYPRYGILDVVSKGEPTPPQAANEG